MAKGFTFFEVLLAMTLLSIIALVAVPSVQHISAHYALTLEQQGLLQFLRYGQIKAQNSAQIWFILIQRQADKKQWCVSMQKKDDYLCDCFAPEQCPAQLQAQFYYPKFSQTRIVSKKYYPEEISRINGIRDTFSSACFVLQAGKVRSIFSLFNVGSLRIKDNQSLSACVYDN
ncbi:prepilin-type N-terminal cleavage/methylation domain-containing protein [Spirabiliibacterium falconis]|uniref:prepilin-type N-terminal cleavage/methylation domain-containing protein n=1 Tax=Spirabiliibacterium falconis TaxID=572023 RepID=UPI001AAE01D3|nr:prepilin-type N-terminal cleavage/methylation domain-containing protein [Spirabiliibacterium falconis]MBE2893846.1 prepilin-type N-terminal cleavage/methylation domain-containing protein [Spirabiliibacterium falconis]